MTTSLPARGTARTAMTHEKSPAGRLSFLNGTVPGSPPAAPARAGADRGGTGVSAAFHKKVAASDSQACGDLGAPDWIRTSGLPGRSSQTHNAKPRFQAVFRQLCTKESAIQKAREAFSAQASRAFACVVVKWWSRLMETSDKSLFRQESNHFKCPSRIRRLCHAVSVSELAAVFLLYLSFAC